MSSFGITWFWSGLALVLLSGVLGRTTNKRWTGILIDSRGRYSLTHLQTVLWTLAILSSYLAALLVSGFNVDNLKIDISLLSLMGITAGSAVLATGVKGIKDGDGSTAGQIAVAGTTITRAGNQRPPITAKFSQVWLEEEGVYADEVINITKFQNLLFTLVALVVYIALASEKPGLPILPENFVWLLGISHAGYVGGKIPDKP